jgi:hypothetical protein
MLGWLALGQTEEDEIVDPCFDQRRNSNLASKILSITKQVSKLVT